MAKDSHQTVASSDRTDTFTLPDSAPYHLGFADSESVYSADTVLAEKEEAKAASSSKGKRFNFLHRRTQKNEQKQTPTEPKKDLSSPQRVMDEMHRRYPLMALNSRVGARPTL